MGWIRMLCSTNLDEMRGGWAPGLRSFNNSLVLLAMIDRTPHSLLLNSCFANSFGKATACFTLEKRGLGVEVGGVMVS